VTTWRGPHGTTDVADAHPEIGARFKGDYERWAKTLVCRLPGQKGKKSDE